MSQDNTTANNQMSQTEPAQPGYIQRSVAALRRRTRRSLSPWIQRRLQRRAGEDMIGNAPPLPSGGRRPPALAVGSTRSLLKRVQRAAAATRIWDPRAGSRQMARVAGFSRSVVRRQQAIQPIAVRTQAPPVRPGWGTEVEMTLPGVPGIAGSEAGSLAPGIRIQRDSSLSAGQRIEPFSTTPSSERRPPQGRTPAQPAPRKLPPAARRFTRIEEISAGGVTVSGAPIPSESHAEEEPSPITQEPAVRGDTPSAPSVQRQAVPRSPERRPEPRRAAASPPSRTEPSPPIQRHEAEAPPPEVQEDSEPARVVEPRHRTARHEDEDLPLVQREGPDSPLPSEPEVPAGPHSADAAAPEGGVARPDEPGPRPIVGPAPVQRQETEQWPEEAMPHAEVAPEPEEIETQPPSELPPVQRREVEDSPATGMAQSSEPGNEIALPPVQHEDLEMPLPPAPRQLPSSAKAQPRDETPSRPEGIPGDRPSAAPSPVQRQEVEAPLPETEEVSEPRREAVPPPVQREESARAEQQSDAAPQPEPMPERDQEPEPPIQREEAAPAPPPPEPELPAEPGDSPEPRPAVERRVAVDLPPIQRETLEMTWPERPAPGPETAVEPRQASEREISPSPPGAEELPPVQRASLDLLQGEEPEPEEVPESPSSPEAAQPPVETQLPTPPIQRQEIAQMDEVTLPETDQARAPLQAEDAEMPLSAPRRAPPREGEPTPPGAETVAGPRQAEVEPRIQRDVAARGDALSPREEPLQPTPEPQVPPRPPQREPSPAERPADLPVQRQIETVLPGDAPVQPQEVGRPPLQREVAPGVPQRVPGEAPEGSPETPPDLGRGVLARAIGRARLSMSKLATPPGRRQTLLQRKAARPGALGGAVSPIVSRLSDVGNLLRLQSAAAASATAGTGPGGTPAVLRRAAMQPVDEGEIPALTWPPSEALLARMRSTAEAEEPAGQEFVLASSLPTPFGPARPAAKATPSSIVQPQAMSLPLVQPPTAQPPPDEEEEEEEEQIQPAPPEISAVSAAPSEPVTVVQRAAAEEIEGEEVDLEELAREIYPLIRRMLAIERERTLGRLT